jgi:Cu-Zn family superoxide dismutase
MKKISMFITAVAVVFAVSCKDTKKTENVEEVKTVEVPKPEVKKVEVHINPTEGNAMVGHATFVEKDGKVSLNVMFEGLTPGDHAIHIHDVADCSSGDGKSAGGHWNPTGVDHGKWMEGNAHHAGDIGNFTADADGKASLNFETDKWCIGCEDATKNILGHGLIVHADPDDFTTQPTGNAGARIGCGEIK